MRTKCLVERDALVRPVRQPGASVAGHSRAAGVEKAQTGDDRVAGEHLPDAGGEHLANRLYLMSTLSELANEVVAGIDQEVGMIDRDHAEGCHPAA